MVGKPGGLTNRLLGPPSAGAASPSLPKQPQRPSAPPFDAPPLLDPSESVQSLHDAVPCPRRTIGPPPPARAVSTPIQPPAAKKRESERCVQGKEGSTLSRCLDRRSSALSFSRNARSLRPSSNRNSSYCTDCREFSSNCKRSSLCVFRRCVRSSSSSRASSSFCVMKRNVTFETFPHHHSDISQTSVGLM